MWNSLRRHLLAFLCALLFTYLSTGTVPLNGHVPARFADSIEGKSWRPFVYRVLSPSLIRLVSSSLSPSQKMSWEKWGENSAWIGNLATKNRLPSAQILNLILFLGLCLLCFYGFFLVLRALILHFYPQISSLETDGWMAFALFPMLLTPSMYYYLYDPGVWFTFGLTLLMMVRRQWLPFLFAFGICTLNKESSLLLVLVLYFWTTGESPKRRFSLVGSTFLVWIAIFGSIRYSYRNSPGTFLESHLIEQWTYEYVWQGISAFLLVVAFFSILAGYGWKQKSLFLRQSLLWTFWPLLFLMLVFGYVYEIRDYYESFIFAYLLSVPTLRSLCLRFVPAKVPVPAV